MIAKLKGIVDSLGADWAVIDVGGVGYQVTCPARVLSHLPAIGQPAVLFVETLIRDEHIRLYGFASETEREWFRLLQGVQGVGSRVALAVLGVLSAQELGNAVAMQDRAMVSRAPGVGQKVAARIVAELRDKAPGIALADAGTARVSAELGGDAGTGAGALSDAVSALVNLGYGRAQAGAAVATVANRADDDATAEQLIRLALKELSQ